MYELKVECQDLIPGRELPLLVEVHDDESIIYGLLKALVKSIEIVGLKYSRGFPATTSDIEEKSFVGQYCTDMHSNPIKNPPHHFGCRLSLCNLESGAFILEKEFSLEWWISLYVVRNLDISELSKQIASVIREGK